MNATKWTPGPWVFVPEGDESLSRHDMGGFRSADRWVCMFGDSRAYYPSEGTPPDIEDAHIIAAAPELYEALVAMTVLASGPAGGVTQAQKVEIIARANAVLAKARGDA